MMTEQEKLERLADVERARLVRTLDELDARRHALARTGRKVVVPAASALVVLAAGALFLLFRRAARRLRPWRRIARDRRRPWRRLAARWGGWARPKGA